MLGKNPYKNRVEVLQGTLDMLILQALQWGPMHGYGIAQAIRLKSSEVLQIETGSLYPALHGSNGNAGSNLNGRLQKASSVRSSTGLQRSERSNSSPTTNAGRRWFGPSLQSWGLRRRNHELDRAILRAP
jgi:hypothetical protein